MRHFLGSVGFCRVGSWRGPFFTRHLVTGNYQLQPYGKMVSFCRGGPDAPLSVEMKFKFRIFKMM